MESTRTTCAETSPKVATTSLRPNAPHFNPHQPLPTQAQSFSSDSPDWKGHSSLRFTDGLVFADGSVTAQLLNAAFHSTRTQFLGDHSDHPEQRSTFSNLVKRVSFSSPCLPQVGHPSPHHTPPSLVHIPPFLVPINSGIGDPPILWLHPSFGT